MKKPHVWVIEIKDGKKYKPVPDAWTTRSDAKRQMLYDWMHNYKGEKFRIAKYVREL